MKTRADLKPLAVHFIEAAVENASTDLLGVMELNTALTEEEANDLLDLLKEVRIAATWEDDE